MVVTARKRTENLQDVPISIEAFSQADLDAKSLTSLQELSQFAPNFSMYNAGIDGSLSNNVYMRGIGNSLGGPGVGIYLDGVYLSTQQAIDLGMLDIERVELLFGPQGTLFGRNTIGGAVSFVSAKPTGEFSGSAEVDVGSYDRFDTSISLNGPLIPGRLNARVALGAESAMATSRSSTTTPVMQLTNWATVTGGAAGCSWTGSCRMTSMPCSRSKRRSWMKRPLQVRFRPAGNCNSPSIQHEPQHRSAMGPEPVANEHVLHLCHVSWRRGQFQRSVDSWRIDHGQLGNQ